MRALFVAAASLACAAPAFAVPITFEVEVPHCTRADVPVMLRSNRLDASRTEHDALTRVDATHYRGTFDVQVPLADFAYKYSSGVCDAASCVGIEKAIDYAGSGRDVADRRLAVGATSASDRVFVWRGSVLRADGSARTGDEKVSFCAPYLSISEVDGSVTIGYDSYQARDVTLELGTTTAYGRTERLSGHHRNFFELTDLVPGTRYFYRVTEDEPGRAPFEGQFVAPPPPDQPFRFAFIGDTQFYGEQQRLDTLAVARQIEAFDPQLVLSPGDLVASERGDGPGGWLQPEPGRFNVIFGLLQPLMSRAPFMVSMGNHEEDVDYFFSAFDFPKPDAPKIDHYWYRIGNVAFVHLYTGRTDGYDYDGILDSQTQWLEDTLRALEAQADVRWRVIVLHRGPFSQGARHPSDGTAFYNGGNAGRRAWGDLWRMYGVDLVLAGHNHNFTLAEHAGIRYLTSCGGAPTHELREPWDATTIYAERVCSANLFSVGARTLSVRAQRVDGTAIGESSFAMCHQDADCAELASPCPEAVEWSCARVCRATCVARDGLSVSPPHVRASWRIGTPPPVLPAIDVTSSGRQTIPVAARCEPAAGWLRCALDRPETPARVALGADTAQLGPGLHSGRVLIESPVATTTVSVELEVLARTTTTSTVGPSPSPSPSPTPTMSPSPTPTAPPARADAGTDDGRTGGPTGCACDAARAPGVDLLPWTILAAICVLQRRARSRS